MVIGLNSAIEFCHPWAWMWADKKIRWIYRRFAKRLKFDLMVCPRHQVAPVHKDFCGTNIHYFDYQMRLRRWEKKKVRGKPYWYSPTRNFLPGRASVANNALSLAWLLKPRICILLGIDYYCGEKYYNDAVKINSGPKDKIGALQGGLRSMRFLAKKGIWKGLTVLSVSQWLSIPQFESVEFEEALNA